MGQQAHVVWGSENGLNREDFGNTAALTVAMEARGFALTGYNDNPRQRAELQGAPKFRGLCGPMWNGDGLRYEDVQAHAVLSA